VYPLVAVALIALTAVDGSPVLVNPAQIAMLRPSNEAHNNQPNKLLVPGVRCIIGLADGRFVTVIEDCSLVAKLIEQAR